MNEMHWGTIFTEEKKMLARAFEGLPIDFFHIGSTSIPDCQAKPILDILGITTDLFAVDEYNDALYLMGFTELGEFGTPGKRFFKRERTPKIHLHIFAQSDPEAYRYLRYSSYMQSHPAEVEKYNELKRMLVDESTSELQKYQFTKNTFIKEIDLKAALIASSTCSQKTYPLQKTKWNKAEILYAMHVNMYLQMTCFAKHLSSIEYICQKDASMICSPIYDDRFNYVLFSRIQEKNISQRINDISSFFEKKGLPFSWWVCLLDKPSSLEQKLVEEGFHKKEVHIGMYKELQQMVYGEKTTSITFHRIDSITGLEDFMNLITAIGGHPDACKTIYSQVPPILYTGDSSLEFYIGSLDGKSIVTGLLVMHLGAAGIYYIATLPSERKKGYATAMIHHLLQRAFEKGYSLATLQASEEGSRLYEKMGFHSCCKLTEYKRKKYINTAYITL